MSPSTGSIAESPELFSGSLAHVMRREDDKVTVIGQAWMVGPGTLATCGHVVEPFLKNASVLVVRFPASGNEYPIDSVRLHPSFLRQPDQLIKYDAAVLSLRLKEPELSAAPLPLCFDEAFKNQQPLWTVRYPAHLGAISSSPDPLAQTGHFLGHLRKQDNFHLLHDLALAPGDSGAPILIDNGVVAMHCGDTASLPGLNLPTTAIRMALWIDALRDLGVSARSRASSPNDAKPRITHVVCIFVTASLVAFSVAMLDIISVRAWMHFHEQQSISTTKGTPKAKSVQPVGTIGAGTEQDSLPGAPDITSGNKPAAANPPQGIQSAKPTEPAGTSPAPAPATTTPSQGLPRAGKSVAPPAGNGPST